MDGAALPVHAGGLAACVPLGRTSGDAVIGATPLHALRAAEVAVGDPPQLLVHRREELPQLAAGRMRPEERRRVVLRRDRAGFVGGRHWSTDLHGAPRYEGRATGARAGHIICGRASGRRERDEPTRLGFRLRPT